jgi:RNA polymerase sigma factor (sigma-70 family)
MFFGKVRFSWLTASLEVLETIDKNGKMDDGILETIPGSACVGPEAPLQELAWRAHAGDQVAFRELSRRLLRTFNWVARDRFGFDAAGADQLAHQTVSEALQAISSGRYDPQRVQFITFAYAVCRRVALRQHARRAPFEPLADVALTRSAKGDVDDYAAAERVEALLGCLKAEGTATSLSEEERYVVVGLAYQKTLAELAKGIGRSLDTVHRRKINGLQKLRACMAAKGFSKGDA